MTSKFQSRAAIMEAAKMLNYGVTENKDSLSVKIGGYMDLKLTAKNVGGKSLYEASYDNMDGGKVSKFMQAALAAEAKLTFQSLGYTLLNMSPVTNITEGKNMVLNFE
jgi:hypothetical protein